MAQEQRESQQDRAAESILAASRSTSEMPGITSDRIRASATSMAFSRAISAAIFTVQGRTQRLLKVPTEDNIEVGQESQATERPLLQTSDGKEMEEGTIRYLVQPRGPRSGPGPWQGGRRKFRRQRPRLSHKGPMPF
nr:PREDICTED: apelin [Bos mutus]